MLCKICNSNILPFSTATILNKYEIQYFRCSNCQFVQTEDPYWLNEAYAVPINHSDVGLVDRNIFLSQFCQAVILMFFDGNAKFIDYGAGYGLFVRMMRDKGFDFYWHDKFCTNLFAQGFEADLTKTNQYELVTAFELFEHFVDPLDEIAKILEFSSNIFFSTELVPSHDPLPHEWWYYGLDHGQHISLYTPKSLAIIAQKFGLKVFSNGKSFHLLTNKKISPYLFRIIVRRKIAILLGLFFRKKSLIANDYFRITGKHAS